jgi:hypothetical protein
MLGMLRLQCQFLQHLLVPGQECVAGLGLSPMRAPRLPKSDGNITDRSEKGRFVSLDNLVKKLYTNRARPSNRFAGMGYMIDEESAGELFRERW